ncbi:MAG: hypothetical protein ACLSDH_06250, partial [Bacilli bacterium]
EYLRYRGNDLATVQFSAICGAMLSNNSWYIKGIIIIRKNNAYYRKKLHPIFVNSPYKKDAVSQIIATFVIETQCINYNGKNYRSKYRY